MKNCIYLFLLLFLTSFIHPPKPHLIVGNWQLVEDQRYLNLWTKAGKKYSIERLAFSSDEISSSIAVRTKGKTNEMSTTFGYRVLEPFDDFQSPILLMKDLCNKQTRLVFSILELNKRTMKLKFEPLHSSEDVRVSTVILTFDRTAGPPENMEE